MKVMEDKYAICKLKPGSRIPALLLDQSFVSITRTEDEISIVCKEDIFNDVMDDMGKAEVFPNWSGLMVQGPLAFSLTGILATITKILAEVEVSVFAISTFDTDYFLISNEVLEVAITALQKNGIIIQA